MGHAHPRVHLGQHPYKVYNLGIVDDWIMWCFLSPKFQKDIRDAQQWE